MNNWTSIKDGLPEERTNPNTHDFEYVLCATIFGDVRPYKFGTPVLSNDTHFWQCGQIMDEFVTHWMQLPDMPDKE